MILIKYDMEWIIKRSHSILIESISITFNIEIKCDQFYNQFHVMFNQHHYLDIQYGMVFLRIWVVVYFQTNQAFTCFLSRINYGT